MSMARMVVMMVIVVMVVMVVMNQGQVILVLVPYPWDSKITNDNNMTVIELHIRNILEYGI